MKLTPLADRVVIKPAPAEEKTVGGIIIPDTAKEKPLKGTVLAVGNGTKDEEMQLKAGDNVLYGKYSGTEVELEGEKYLIMHQKDVLAIIGKELLKMHIRADIKDRKFINNLITTEYLQQCNYAY